MTSSGATAATPGRLDLRVGPRRPAPPRASRRRSGRSPPARSARSPAARCRRASSAAAEDQEPLLLPRRQSHAAHRSERRTARARGPAPRRPSGASAATGAGDAGAGHRDPTRRRRHPPAGPPGRTGRRRLADVAAHSSSPVVTSTTPSWSRALIRNAATIPRAPVIAFQPAIAAAREASGVWSLTAAAMPDVDRRAADPGRRSPRAKGRRRSAPAHSATSDRSPIALPRRSAVTAPCRSATRPQIGNATVVATAARIPITPTSDRLRFSRSTWTRAYSGAAAISPPP